MDWMTWYNSLAKPSWTPSPATIGLIWTILYPVIVVSFGFVFVMAFRRKVFRETFCVFESSIPLKAPLSEILPPENPT